MSRLRQRDLFRDEADAQQVAALCWRRHRGVLEALLITSRDTGRWIIPKGWPIAGIAPHEVAAREAWEEAGVRGHVGAACIGSFGYDKLVGPARLLRCIVAVYPFEVVATARTWPERRARERRWMPAPAAAMLLREADLGALIADFDPDAADGRNGGPHA
jgi:8-oxo-dGTP pyrophosphatase MutT (NUDIX family)